MSDHNHRLVVFDWCLGLLVGALFVAPVLAAEKATDLETGEEAILAALDEKTTVEFIDEPLSGVVQYFKHQRGIEIQVDTKALEDVKMGADTPISKSIRNVKFRSALNLILRDLDLTWVITDEVLMITTPEEAELHLTTRVYDVSGLAAVQDPRGKRWQDFESLIRAITGTIDPESWEDVGGPGSMNELEYQGASVLIVRQTLDVHGQVRRLLDDLAKVAEEHGDEVIPTRKRKKPQAAGPNVPGTSGFGGMGGGGGYM
jgi:hypothetical protein